MPPRALTIPTCLIALATSCGPDDEPRDRCRQKPTFLVSITVEKGSFPEDTRVTFEYGGGVESFELGASETPPKVVFCQARPSTTQDGAGGDAGSPAAPVTEIVCELWTGGSTDVAVTASGFEPVTGYKLRTDRELCTVSATISLTVDGE